MTTAEILKQLESAKSETEMLAKAEDLGVTRAFFNAGSAVDTAAKALPKTGKSKAPGRRKMSFAPILEKSKQHQKKIARRPVGA